MSYKKILMELIFYPPPLFPICLFYHIFFICQEEIFIFGGLEDSAHTDRQKKNHLDQFQLRTILNKPQFTKPHSFYRGHFLIKEFGKLKKKSQSQLVLLLEDF